MPRNGSGTYVLPPGQPVVTLTTISSSVHNTFASDIANALTTSICTDGQTPMTANLPLGNHKITNLANGTLANDAINLSQLDDEVSDLTDAISEAKRSIMGTNYLDNGGMSVAQAATSIALTTGPAYGSLDRWFASMATTAQGSWGRVPLSGLSRPYAGQLKRNPGSTSVGQMYIAQVIDTERSIELSGRTVILSFLAGAGANFSAAASTIGIKIFTGTGTDQGRVSMINGTWTGAATPLNTTQVITTSITRYDFSVALPSNVTEIGVQFSYTPVGTAGADDALYITEVQLERSLNGDLKPSTFECEAPEITLAKCQRFYQQVILAVIGYNDASANLSASANYAVRMRATPAVAQITNDYAFTSVNSFGTATNYTFIHNSYLIGYRQVIATGSSQWSELTAVSADL